MTENPHGETVQLELIGSVEATLRSNPEALEIALNRLNDDQRKTSDERGTSSATGNFKLEAFETESGPRVSSNDIAEFTGKRHDHVIRDVERLLSGLYGGLPKVGESSVVGCERSHYVNSQRRQMPCYLLDRRHAECLATGYDVRRRMAIIDAFIAAEEKAAVYSAEGGLVDLTADDRLPQNFAECLRMLADQVDENAELALENESLKPKAEFFERVVAMDQAVLISTVCKTQEGRGLPGQNGMFRVLRRDKVLIDAPGKERHNKPYQKYIDAGLFRVRGTEWESNSGEKSGFSYTPLVTPEGVQWLIDRYGDGKWERNLEEVAA